MERKDRAEFIHEMQKAGATSCDIAEVFGILVPSGVNLTVEQIEDYIALSHKMEVMFLPSGHKK